MWIFILFMGWVFHALAQGNLGGWMLTESADAWGRV